MPKNIPKDIKRNGRILLKIFPEKFKRFAHSAGPSLQAWRLAGTEDWRTGGLGKREVWDGKWVPGGWKIGLWAVQASQARPTCRREHYFCQT